MQEAIDIVEDDNSVDVRAVFIEPPDVNINSDEDSAEEDEGGLVDNLSKRQLKSKAEIVFSDKTRIDDFEKYKDRSQTEKEVKQKSKKRKLFSWKKADLQEDKTIFPEPDCSVYRNQTPLQIFEKIIDDEFYELLITETTRYAAQHNMKDFKINTEELKVFFAILFLSGYNSVPSKRSYWENAEDLRNELVVNAIRRNRFLEICRFIHVTDNTKINNTGDKMWKLRPMIKLLQDRCISLFIPEKNLAYDECMVAYFGRHSCKQFIRGKPIRFGYKLWCLNTPSGYLVNFDIYQGKNPYGNNEYEDNFGKCAAPMIQMLNELPENKSCLPYSLYFDNLFTNMNLLTYLKGKGYGATGTFRENRIPKDCPLQSSKEMKKLNRGSYDHQLCSENIIIVKWVDNSVVSVASTCHSLQPINKVSRYSKESKQKINVSQPNLITKYNKFMGGTDRMDQNMSYYRIGFRGKKWYWSLFTWMLDAAMHNAWLLMKKSGTNISQLDFRRSIVQIYLQRYKNPPIGLGRPTTSKFSSISSRMSDDIRLDRKDHFVTSCNRRRCAAPECNKTIRTKCCKCDVGLCVNCFMYFHTG